MVRCWIHRPLGCSLSLAISFVHCHQYASYTRWNSLLMWTNALHLSDRRFVFYPFANSFCVLSIYCVRGVSIHKSAFLVCLLCSLVECIFDADDCICLWLAFFTLLNCCVDLVPARLWFGNYIYINLYVYFNLMPTFCLPIEELEMKPNRQTPKETGQSEKRNKQM